MTNNEYDVIVVGARCAGSPTAMLLAQKGFRVLVVDRATFPSDTVSTHMIHAPGIAALQRWGLRDAVEASGCPAIERYSFDFGPVAIAGRPREVEGVSTGFAPRRVILDQILVDGAAKAGAEVREGFSVEEFIIEDGVVVGIRGHGKDGKTVTERARVVIGADGRNSRLAKTVAPLQYSESPRLQCSYYTYWRDLPTDGFETVIRPYRGWAAIPTNDDLTMVVVGCPVAETDSFRSDLEANYLKTFDLAPDFADRVAAATRVERFAGAAVANYFRKPFGPGWALVGDAGYNKDSITAKGITDAFLDAERCADALVAYFDGGVRYDEAMGRYQRTRDSNALPIYEFTLQLATLEPPPLEMQQMLGAVAGNQDAEDDFVSITAGTVSPIEFFDPANIGRIIQAAA